MKTETRKVYQCDHCGKRMLSAGAMARHEKGCSQNPNNCHVCFRQCIHLKKTIEHVSDAMCSEYESCPIDITHFTCEKLDREMYSYKFEKAKGFKPEYLLGLTRMPLSCDMYVSDSVFI